MDQARVSSVPLLVTAEAGNEADPVDADVLALAGKLNRSPSGLAFIYETLDVLASRYALDDAVFVVDDTPLARQVFRLRRADVAMGAARRWLRDALQASAGLYTRPGTVDPTVGSYVTHLATTALVMDLLRHDASHDPLTGLLNRRSYDRALANAAARRSRYGLPFSLVLIDLDNFKVVNDRLGHAGGDEALRSVGQEIRGILRTGDVAARLGGDEFALIVVNADSPSVAAPLIERLRRVVAGAEPSAALSFSWGVACFPVDTDDVAELQRIADKRLYADKASVG